MLTLFVPAFQVQSLSFPCRLDRHRFDGAEKLPGNGRVDTGSAEGQTPRQPQHQIGAVTAIDRLSRRAARVAYHQAAPAAPTGQQASQQRPSPPPPLRTSHFAISVDRELLL